MQQRIAAAAAAANLSTRPLSRTQHRPNSGSLSPSLLCACVCVCVVAPFPSFSSRLSDLYPAADDPFFTQPQTTQTQSQTRQQHQQSTSRTSPTRSLQSSNGGGRDGKDGTEEHKYPEQSQQHQQHPPSDAIQPRRQPSDLVDHRAHPSDRAHPTPTDSLSVWGADPFDMFGEMDRTFDAQMQRMGRIMEQFTGGMGMGLGAGFGAGGLGDHSNLTAGFPKDGSSSYSYHSSSSSYSAGPDGSSTPFYRHVSQSSSCVDGVSASRARYEDSLGNRREQQGWGLGQQHRELMLDRNARGEERTRENLKELQPADVEQFTKQWEQRRAQVDPKNRLIGAAGNSSGNQRALKNEPIRSIKSGGADKDTRGQAMHA